MAVEVAKSGTVNQTVDVDKYYLVAALVVAVAGQFVLGTLFSYYSYGTLTEIMASTMIVSAVFATLLGLPITYFLLTDHHKLRTMFYPPSIHDMSRTRFYFFSRFFAVPFFAAAFLTVVFITNLGFIGPLPF